MIPITGFARAATRSAVAIGLVVISTACDTTAGTTPATGSRIVATTTIWADITTRIACGEPVAALVPAGADPHSYETSLRDRETVEGAAVLVANGAGLEASADALLDAAVDAGVRTVVVTDHLDLLDDSHDDDGHDSHDDRHDDRHDDGHDDDGHDDDGHDSHGDGDPHVWLDPLSVVEVIDEIDAALTAAGLDTCADEVRTSLEQLDRDLDTILDGIAPEDRVLVTGHDALAYFAARYDFEVLGAVVPSTSTLAEPSAGDLAALTELIEARAVRAIFTDAFETAVDAEALGNRIGVEVVPLATGSLTDDAPSYDELMRSNARAIALALS